MQPKWRPLHSYALALQIPLMDKLLDSGVDINLLDKVSYVFVIFHFLCLRKPLGAELISGVFLNADAGWLHPPSQGSHRQERGCH